LIDRRCLHHRNSHDRTARSASQRRLAGHPEHDKPDNAVANVKRSVGAGGGVGHQTPGLPCGSVPKPWATGLTISSRVQVVRNAKLRHSHWLPKTALDTGCDATIEDDSSAVPPSKRATAAASASRLRVDHGLIMCGSPVHSPGLDLRRDLFYERDHHLAAVRAIATLPSGACRNRDIDVFCAAGRGPVPPASSARDGTPRIPQELQIEKLHWNQKLAGTPEFPRLLDVIPETDRKLRKVGTTRIIGGISSRRAVHRCPVADFGPSLASNDDNDFPATTERATRPIQ
jgi:hypothetical protein